MHLYYKLKHSILNVIDLFYGLVLKNQGMNISKNFNSAKSAIWSHGYSDVCYDIRIADEPVFLMR